MQPLLWQELKETIFLLFLCMQDLQGNYKGRGCLYLPSEFEDLESQFKPVC